jgi:hypothetical protein
VYDGDEGCYQRSSEMNLKANHNSPRKYRGSFPVVIKDRLKSRITAGRYSEALYPLIDIYVISKNQVLTPVILFKKSKQL